MKYFKMLRLFLSFPRLYSLRKLLMPGMGYFKGEIGYGFPNDPSQVTGTGVGMNQMTIS